MTRLTPPVQDEELSAFLDGELPIPRARQIATALKNNPQLAKKLRTHAMHTRLLIDYHADVLDEPIPQRLLRVLESGGCGAEDKT